jgi:probable HAF family extracellular repeat protein
MFPIRNFRWHGAACAALLYAATFAAPSLFADSSKRHFAQKMGHRSPQNSAKPADKQNYGEIHAIPLPPGAIGGYALSINNRGTAAGQILLPTGAESTFVYSGGDQEIIAHPTEPFTSVPSISDVGDRLFGNWGGFDYQTAGTFDRKTRTFEAFPAIPGKPINIGLRMNDAGVALGVACQGNFLGVTNCSEWLFRNGKYEFLNLPTLNQLALSDINNRGQVVGYYLKTPPFDYRAFVYEDGVLTDLPIFNDAGAFGINNQGQILLLAEFSPTELFRPALYDRGAFTELPSVPNLLSTFWYGMNERGDLAGGAAADFSFVPTPFLVLRR